MGKDGVHFFFLFSFRNVDLLGGISRADGDTNGQLKCLSIRSVERTERQHHVGWVRSRLVVNPSAV